MKVTLILRFGLPLFLTDVPFFKIRDSMQHETQSSSRHRADFAGVNKRDNCMQIRLVPGGGIEPPQAFWALRILSPLRLPISPSPLISECTSALLSFGRDPLSVSIPDGWAIRNAAGRATRSISPHGRDMELLPVAIASMTSNHRIEILPLSVCTAIRLPPPLTAR